MGNHSRVPLPKFGGALKIILVRPEIEGNIGAIARSMLNFGCSDLRLVDSRISLESSEVRRRAKHAGQVLDNAKSFSNLEEAVYDSTLVVGTTGKRETGPRTVFRSLLSTKDVVKLSLRRKSESISMVFGAEGMGLSQKELEACDLLSTVPTWEGYPILNLSHAVSIYLYEYHIARIEALMNSEIIDEGLADHSIDLNQLNPNVRRTLIQSLDNFAESLPGPQHRIKGVQNVLRRVVLRGTPQGEEAQRIIGAIIDATTALRYLSGDDRWRRERRRRLQPDDFSINSEDE